MLMAERDFSSDGALCEQDRARCVSTGSFLVYLPTATSACNPAHCHSVPHAEGPELMCATRCGDVEIRGSLTASPYSK